MSASLQHRGGWILGLVPLFFAVGCGADEPAPSRGRDLLAESPHELRDQPGRFGPGDPVWQRLAFDGWRVDSPSGDDAAVAWAVVRESRLRLPRIGPPDDAEIELELVPPPGAPATVRVAVRLNDIALGEIDLGAERARHVLAAPSAMWRSGENLISFRGDTFGRDAHGDVFFGLSSLRYDPRGASIERSAGGYRVPSSGGLVYRIETLTSGELRVAGTTSGDGVLELSVRAVDAWSGMPRPEPLARHAFPARDGQLTGVVALPRARETLELEARWTGSAETSDCELTGLTYAELEPAKRRSVLFVSIDTLSAQHLSLYGYARQTSPELAAFSRDAVLFRNCRANAPWTIPSYMSQFTGLLPGSHMLERKTESERDPDPWEQHQIAPNRWTLAEFFRAAGYRTAAFVDNPWLAHGFGFPSGFDEYDSAASEVPVEDPEGGLRSIVPRVLDWLDGVGTEPFFLFVQAFDPHAPYTPVAPWKGRFGADDLVDPGWTVPVGRGQSMAYGCIPEHVAIAMSPGAPRGATLPVAPFVAAYDEKVLEVDAAMAQLLAGLKERGIYDELLIVFSADHGESTTGHDFFFGHGLLYNDVLHVPLVVRLPGGEQRGRVVEPVVQLVDLYPTLLDFVLGDPARGLHGSSLMPLLRDGSPHVPRDVAYAEWGAMEQASLESGGWKLIASQPLFARRQTQLSSPRLDRKRFGELCPELASGFFTDAEISAALERRPEARAFLEQSLAGPFFELYHLTEDPLETRDVAAAHPEVVARLLDTLAIARGLGQEAQATATFLAPTHLDEAAREELRDLGYGGGD